MAWTQTDLDRLDAAISSNIRTVTYADGRTVSYQDVDKMLAVRNAMRAEIAASASQVVGRTRITRGQMSR